MSSLAARLRRQLGVATASSTHRLEARMPAISSSPHPANREPVSEQQQRIARSAEQRQHIATPSVQQHFTMNASVAADQTSIIQVTHQVVSNKLGGYVRGNAVLKGSQLHGLLPLSSALDVDGPSALLMSGDTALADFRPERALYFDLETTGLPRGARSKDSWQRRSADRAGGTPLAFLIGALQIAGDGKVEVHQFLLRQQPDETAQLADFCELLRNVDYLVSFNGRSFDRNILADRLLRNRMSPERLLSLPHLDLLHPSARLYRGALGGSSLDVLERRVLGVQRPPDEVRGAEVPERWMRYLRTGDPRFLYAVLDHNVLDLLSLLTLGGHLSRALRTPGLCLAEPAMLAGAARLLLQRGQPQVGEALLHRLSSGSSHDDVVYRALASLAEHLRKMGRHDEALPLWRRMMEEKGITNLAPWRATVIALERRLGQPQQALAVITEVLEQIVALPVHSGRESDLVEFSSRRDRLTRRLESSQGQPQSAA